VLHHVELYVASLPITAAWWGPLLTRLGWTPYQSWPSGSAWRSPDGPYLVFVQSGNVTPYSRTGTGLNHVALRTGGRAEVDAVTAELVAGGTRLLYADRHPYAGGPEHYAAYLEDPDGLKVELVAD